MKNVSSLNFHNNNTNLSAFTQKGQQEKHMGRMWYLQRLSTAIKKIIKDINPKHPCQAVKLTQNTSLMHLLFFSSRLLLLSFSQNRTIDSLPVVWHQFQSLIDLLLILTLFFKVQVLTLRQLFSGSLHFQPHVFIFHQAISP